MALPAGLTENAFDDTISDTDVDTAAELAVIVDAIHTRLNAIAVAVNLIADEVDTLNRVLSHPMFSEAYRVDDLRSRVTTRAGTVSE